MNLVSGTLKITNNDNQKKVSFIRFSLFVLQEDVNKVLTILQERVETNNFILTATMTPDNSVTIKNVSNCNSFDKLTTMYSIFLSSKNNTRDIAQIFLTDDQIVFKDDKFQKITIVGSNLKAIDKKYKPADNNITNNNITNNYRYGNYKIYGYDDYEYNYEYDEDDYIHLEEID